MAKYLKTLNISPIYLLTITMKINLNEGYYFMDNLSHIGKLTKPNNPKNKGDIYWLMKQKKMIQSGIYRDRQ